MSDDRRAYDPDEYFGRAAPREVPDLKAEAAERLRSAIAYARLHAPELLDATCLHCGEPHPTGEHVKATLIEAVRERGTPAKRKRTRGAKLRTTAGR